MQIAFLTLFLGLVAGVRPVAVSAGPGVAAVELRLDGAAVGRLAAPSWRGEIDFGRDLLPHHLEALALDAAGREQGRVEQWINVPGPQAKVQFLMDGAAPGEPQHVRLEWASITRSAPIEAKLTLDGRPLHLDGSYQAELPPRPPDSATSVLSAELRFADGVVARRDLALGRDYDDSVATELTALPVWVKQGAEMPPVTALQDWFREAGGQAVRVDAVDQGPPQILLVRDSHVAAKLRPDVRLPPVFAPPDLDIGMPAGGTLGYVWPTPLANQDPLAELFAGVPAQAVSRPINYILAFTSHSDPPPLRLADAVAAAGLQVSTVTGPRAVVLVLAPGARDESRFTGAMVRRYLAAIHVPLLVWSAGSADAAMQAAWGGGIEDITTGTGVRAAKRQIVAATETQRIVWLNGRHLPQDVALAPGVTAVQLEPPPAR
jgi:hypothetical protein